MKERLSFTLAKESVKILEELLKKIKYRNRSHIVEIALQLLHEEEQKQAKKKSQKGGGR